MSDRCCRLWRAHFGAVLVMLMLAACGPSQQTLSGSVSSSPTAPPGAAGVVTAVPTVAGPDLTVAPTAAGPVAPDITVRDVDGRAVRLSDFRGKTVLLNFRATWCGYCRQEAPELQKAHESFPDLVIMAVNIQESPDKVVAYRQQLKLTFTMYIDATGEAAQAYRVRGIPASFFIGPQGHIFSQQVGPLTLQAVRSALAGQG
jgi:cytochrome c biogenesis protein CcmG, thiol:disulfide interchange protein DsbE